MGEEGLGVVLVTPEPAPLAALGGEVSQAVAGLLDEARVTVYTGAQPDVAAAMIAAVAGTAVEREPLRPVIRGVLHTGSAPLYLTVRLEGGRVVESEATTEAPWPVDDKVVAEELPDFLRSLS